MRARAESTDTFSIRHQKFLSFLLVAFISFATIFAQVPYASADVQKSDLIFGQSVEERNLSSADCPNVDAEYAYLMDSNGRVYFERNATTPTKIASITKVMTAIVALDHGDLNDQINVSKKAEKVGESEAGLKNGDSLTLEAALKALIVPSGNDAAIAIAESIGAKMVREAQENEEPITLSSGQEATEENGEEVFVDAMNKKAEELGLKDTVFTNPHGLDSDEYSGDQHSTAEDVAKIIQAAMKYESIRIIADGGDTSISVQTSAGKTKTVKLKSTDKLLSEYDPAMGLKTGYTESAGYCFAGAASDEGIELYSVVLNSSSETKRFEDTKNLFEWAYTHEVDLPLANSPETTTYIGQDGVSREVPVVAYVAHSDWMDKTFRATLVDPDASIKVFDLNGNVTQSVTFNEVHGDVKAGDKVGTITYQQRNEVLDTVDIVAAEDMNGPGFFDRIEIFWQRAYRLCTGQPLTATSATLNEPPLLNDRTTSGAV
jgi:D-alanyl-D-alanine carboxypeptidase (penicillin-binding protein 5/6)